MRYCIKTEDGKERYYVDIDTASALLGISRRTFFEYLKKLNIKTDERKRIGLKLFFDEEVISRAWIMNRRKEKYSAYPNNRGCKSLERKKQLGIDKDSLIIKREG